VRKTLDAGHYDITWDGSDNDGRTVGSGIYFYTVRHDGDRKSRKMILVR